MLRYRDIRYDNERIFYLNMQSHFYGFFRKYCYACNDKKYLYIKN